MKLCRVIGNVVATVHHEAYDARSVMVVRLEEPGGEVHGSGFLAVDTVQSGPGDRVLVMSEGNGVRQILGSGSGPIRSLIVAVVDDIEVAS